VEHFEVVHGEYLISTDPARLDLGLIQRWLAEESYWAQGRTMETVERSVPTSLNFGAYTADGAMVGAARMVTDYATFGWLCDVFVVDAHRGRGVGKALVAAAVTHPDMVGLKRTILATADAHSLYARHGFRPMGDPENKWMIREGPTA
jgi:GNAT superfamily N-acetyltransferase